MNFVRNIITPEAILGRQRMTLTKLSWGTAVAFLFCHFFSSNYRWPEATFCPGVNLIELFQDFCSLLV